MFSHEHQPTGRETASLDPTRVLTEGESDIVKWHNASWERRNRPRLSAWGLRLTQITIAVALLAQAPGLGDCWAHGQLKKQLEKITAKHARCDGKCVSLRINYESPFDQKLNEVPLFLHRIGPFTQQAPRNGKPWTSRCGVPGRQVSKPPFQ